MIFLLVSTWFLATFLFLVFLLNQQVKFIIFVLDFVSTICDLITLPVYLLIDQPWKIKLRSKTVTAERHYESNNNYSYWQAKENSQDEGLPKEDQTLRSLCANLTHLSELLTIVEKVHKGKKCLGRRKILNKKMENGEIKFELSNEFEWRSYDEVLATIRELAKVLHFKFQLKRGDRVAIFAETSPEYLIIFFALQSLGCEVITLRSAPDEKTISFVLNFNEVKLVFTQTNFVKLLNKMKKEMPTVSKLICFRHPFGSETDEEEIRIAKYEVFEYDQLLREAQDHPPLDFKKSLKFSPNDISTIMNTSGSSGVPKCVLTRHSSWIAYIKESHLESNEESTFLAYVEGSHVMELMSEVLNFVCGIKMAFGIEETFLTGFGLLAEGCIGDLQASEATNTIAFAPTLEQFRSMIETSTRNKSAYLSALYDFAFEYKKKWVKRRFICRLIDVLFFKSIKNEFSKKLETITSGGAPIRPKTLTFLKLYLNINITLAYGATESMRAAISTFGLFDDDNEALIIPDGIKIRLKNWQEGGYKVDDKPNARGEIIIGSDVVSAGYYKNEKETVESFFEEDGTRWWRSSDIGEINEYGQLKIIDRKSNFAKLYSAYFITMGKVESVLRGCGLVENIAVHVNPYFDFVTAIVVPDEENVCKLAEELGKDTDDLARLCNDKDLEKAVVDELARYGTKNGLVPLELPAYVKLVLGKWTAENGFVTETKKIRRKLVYAFYKDSIDAMYDSV